LIEVHNLTKHYGKKVALGGISFSVASGEVVGLLGLNGAGKSTTMNILTGYISATSGEVSIDSHDIMKESREAKRVVGYLPEQLAFYNDMRVMEYLNFIYELKGLSRNKAKRKEHLDAICEQVGLSDKKGRLINNLSKGYRQRVGFAQALIGHPKVLILDEPTVGVDPSQVIEIRQLIKTIGESTTIIISSHILSEIQTICDRVIIIDEGRVIANDTLENLSSTIHPNHKLIVRVQGEITQIKAALASVESIINITEIPERETGTCDVCIEGKTGCDIRADVFYACAKADLPLLHTYGHEFSLEDVFLHLVGDNQEDKNIIKTEVIQK